MQKFINGKNYSIKRFRWDRALHKKGQSPWKDVGFAAYGANGFAMEKKALGEGAERLAYRFNEIKYNNETNTYKQVGKLMVAKNSILANEKETKEHFHVTFAVFNPKLVILPRNSIMQSEQPQDSSPSPKTHALQNSSLSCVMFTHTRIFRPTKKLLYLWNDS